MKKVLLIAFDFPPHRSSGVYRPAAFTKYLLRAGWQTTVLTVAGAPGVEDASLLRKIPPEVRIVRTSYWQLRQWESKAAGVIRTLTSHAPGASTAALETPRPEATRPTSHSLLRKLADSVQNSLYFPDESAGWIPFALERALELHFQERFDAVYTTHPPRAGHVVGMLLSAFCRLPWVAEFRDPWTIPPGTDPIPGLPVPSPARNRKLLRCMLQVADAVVPVTPGYAEELVSLWKAPFARVHVINNGFDDEDFPALGSNNGRPAWMRPDNVHLAHFGTIYPEFHGSFFPALLEAVRESRVVRSRLRVHLIGFPSPEVMAFGQREDLRDVLQFHNFLSHADALAAMRSSQCLLLFYGHPYTSQSSIPGKIYEYLRVGRPVLVLAYEGGLRQLVEQGNAGWVLPPDDIPGIKRLLTELASQTLPLPPPPAPEFVSQFRYDHLAKKLAATLDKVSRRER
ncbi:MAG: glycosyltransferase family 4 protein [Acidobacteria bacterium]|nr:glycosyltransferase family 4 protein [Acidobacteriota bacterium]